MGAHVARTLLDMGHQVTVLDDLSGGFRDQVPEGARFVEGSILDEELVGALFREEGYDYVYHLAAYAAEGLSHFIKRFNYRNNLIGSVNLINEAVKHDVRCFVFTSSIAVYGELEPPMREDMHPEPEDPYGVAKYAVELELEATRKMFGLPYVVFRPHNVYGEYQNLGDRYRNVVGIFMRQLKEGEPLTIFGDGEQTRAFTYIGDVAEPIARAVEVEEAYGEVFNIGGDTPYTVNELVRAVMEAMGTEGRIRHVEERTEVKHAWADHGKAERVFGHQGTTPLEDGLARMARWARSAGVRKSRKFEAIEIERGLPPVWLEE